MYEVAKVLSSQPECDTCRLCEEKVGLVYIFNAEKRNFRVEDVLSIKTGVHYLKRTEENQCVFFDNEKGRCKIYSKRPLACRIYPLDLMKLDGELWWVAYPECPIMKRYQNQRNLFPLIKLVSELESATDAKTLKEWENLDRYHTDIEAMGWEHYNTVRLKKHGIKDVIFPL